jgi:hypothetical protein
MTLPGTPVRRRRGLLALAAAGGAAVTVAVAGMAGAATAPPAGPRVDLRVLVLAPSTAAGDIAAWQDNLRREGVPHDVVTSATPLTAGMLADGERARYEAVIVAGADGTNGGRPSGFDAAEWTALRAFERHFGIRQLDVNAVPGPPLGLSFASTTGALDGQTAALTAAGRTLLPDLAGPVAWDDNDPAVVESNGFTAAPCAAADAACAATSYEPLLPGTGGQPLLGVAQMKDGREEMVASFDANEFQLHNAILRRALVDWVTGGVHLGADRSFLSMDVDDIFLPDDKWDPTLNATPEGDGTAGQQDLRMTPADVQRLLDFQTANGVQLNMLFNGAGSDEAVAAANGAGDPLTTAFLAARAQLPWVNHTYSHPSLGAPNPGAPSSATIQQEISRNVQWAQTNALPNFDPAVLVTGEHSGIGTSNPPVAPNPNMAGALNAQGITSVGADSSREVGQRSLGGALTLPRYPMNVFYNVSTWGDQLDEYNWLYLAKGAPGGDGNCTNTATTTCFTQPTTQAQFVDREATAMLRHMTGNDPRSHYAHQTNLISDPASANVANRGDGILYAVLGEALRRYRAYFSSAAPLQQPGQAALTEELRRQEAWRSAVAAGQVSGYVQDGKVRIDATVPLQVPVTGASAGSDYAGRRSGWTAVVPGTTTLDVGDPRSTVAPVVTGTPAVGATLTATTGTFTGTTPITTTRRWQRRTAAGNWSDIDGATGATYLVGEADRGLELRHAVSAVNRVSTWGLGVSDPVRVPGPSPPPGPAGTDSHTVPAQPVAGIVPPPVPGTGPSGSARTPVAAAFTCATRRAARVTLTCTLRDRTGVRTARIRVTRGARTLALASGKVVAGRVPAVRIPRLRQRAAHRITITVRLAGGRTRTMTRSVRL